MNSKRGQRLRAIRLSAVLLVTGALAGCGTGAREPGPVIDAQLARSSSTAQAAYEQGMLQQAARLYEQSLTRARAMDNAVEIGNAAYNLAVCCIALQQPDRARQYLREAKAEFARAGINLADVLMVECKLARQQQDSATAMKLADQILTDPRSSPTAAHRLQVHVLKGQMACDRQDLAAAQVELRAAEVLGAGASPSLRAEVAHLDGRVAMSEGRVAEAAAAFDRQADLHQQAGQYGSMSGALMRAGRAHLASDHPQLAADRLFRSARSAWAQGRTDHASELAGEALAIEGITDDKLGVHIKSLLVEIKESASTAED